MERHVLGGRRNATSQTGDLPLVSVLHVESDQAGVPAIDPRKPTHP